jgi:putative transposase
MHHKNRQHRRRQYNEPGQAHELTFCCYNRFKFLSAERTCCWLAEALNEARVELQFHLWAYVFMPEHVHLVVFPLQPKYEIRHILKAIKEPVGRRAMKHLRQHSPEWLPRITRRCGQRIEAHFWQSGGGFDSNVCEPAALWQMIEYIHLNPVRRGLIERASDWKWSSAAWYEGRGSNGLMPDPIPLLWIDNETQAVQ